MTLERIQVNISGNDKQLLKALMQKYGFNRSSAMRYCLNKVADLEGIKAQSGRQRQRER